MPLGVGHAFEGAYLYGSNNPVLMVDPSGRRAAAANAQSAIASAEANPLSSVDLAGNRGSILKNLKLWGLHPDNLTDGQLLRLYIQTVAFPSSPELRQLTAIQNGNSLVDMYNTNVDQFNVLVERKACAANIAYSAACKLRNFGPIKMAMEMNIDVEVCPVFGCVGIGLHGGLPSAKGGVGLAVSLPSLSVTKHDENEKSGCSQSQTAFVNVQFLVASAGGSWSRERTGSAGYSEWKGGLTGGLALPMSKFDPPNGKSGFGLGAGFVHSWGCTA